VLIADLVIITQDKGRRVVLYSNSIVRECDKTKARQKSQNNIIIITDIIDSLQQYCLQIRAAELIH